MSDSALKLDVMNVIDLRAIERGWHWLATCTAMLMSHVQLHYCMTASFLLNASYAFVKVHNQLAHRSSIMATV